MYQPSLRPEQIKALYYLKLRRNQPMTVLLREAVDLYFSRFGGTTKLIADARAEHAKAKGATNAVP